MKAMTIEPTELGTLASTMRTCRHELVLDCGQLYFPDVGDEMTTA
jgi:hypothetical protein